jgi:flagella basal body P-ring formation protein FlgA
MTLPALFLLLTPPAEAPCVEVPGPAVRARDLAPAAPAFAALAPDHVLGYAPSPGTRRWFKPPGAGPEVCVARAVQPVAREKVLAAIEAARAAKGWGEVSFELISYPGIPLPEGTIRLDRGHLRPGRRPPDPALVLWHGVLEYEPQRTLPFQIAVRLTAERDVFAATRALGPGHAITAGDVHRERRPAHGLAALEAAGDFTPVGLESARRIAAGEEIGPAQVARPKDVKRGDLVNVVVQSKTALLRLEAKSLATGRRGEWIVLENPSTRRRFRGRIEGPGRVLVEPSGAIHAQ